MTTAVRMTAPEISICQNGETLMTGNALTTTPRNSAPSSAPATLPMPPAIETPPIATIPFDPQMFGLAANNGQMIAEVAAGHRTTEIFLQIAQRLTGRGETKKPRGSFLAPFLEKLRSK